VEVALPEVGAAVGGGYDGNGGGHKQDGRDECQFCRVKGIIPKRACASNGGYNTKLKAAIKTMRALYLCQHLHNLLALAKDSNRQAARRVGMA
jgi:hypothetical protein